MQRRTLIKLTGLAGLGTITLSACGGRVGEDSGNGGSGGEGGSGDGNYTIVVVPKDATNPWFVRMEEGVKRFAESSGLDAYQKGPAETDATQQANVIQDLVAQKVDAICVVPVDPSAIEPALKKAQDAGILVITHEGASQQNSEYDIEAFNNAAYGGFIMDNLAKAMGEEGLYTTMVGHVTNASHNEWADGGVAQAKEKYPNLKLLEEEPRVESTDDGEVAYQKAKELFKKYPDLKGVMGTSSFDAPGVARAIQELGLKDKAFTAGTGMPSANAQLLKDGVVAALTLWDPADAGEAMCVLAQKILDGEEITAPVDLGIEGYDAMEFSEENEKVLEGEGWIVITADNVDDFGF